jgi:hypothetical protein
MQDALTTDFYDKGIADKKGAPDMPKLSDDYYSEVAKTAELSQDEFKKVGKVFRQIWQDRLKAAKPAKTQS